MGRESAASTIALATGRTIKGITLEPDSNKSEDVHNGEKVTLEFTDGSTLVLDEGCNSGDLSKRVTGLQASDLSLDFIATFREGTQGR